MGVGKEGKKCSEETVRASLMALVWGHWLSIVELLGGAPVPKKSRVGEANPSVGGIFFSYAILFYIRIPVTIIVLIERARPHSLP